MTTPHNHTAACYSPGRPRHNAEVFLFLWGHEVQCIYDDGIAFETGDSSGGNITFFELVDYMRATDEHRLLSRADVILAVTMIYHDTPSHEPPPSRETVMQLVKGVGERFGRDVAKALIGRYAESFGKVRDDQLASLWEDFKDLERGGRA